MKSNCLIQALLHRLKGCPVYQVIHNDSDWHKHFVWWDSEIGSYLHFTWVEEVYLPKFPYFTMFEGYIENYPYDKEKIKLRLVL